MAPKILRTPAPLISDSFVGLYTKLPKSYSTNEIYLAYKFKDKQERKRIDDILFNTQYFFNKVMKCSKGISYDFYIFQIGNCFDKDSEIEQIKRGGTLLFTFDDYFPIFCFWDGYLNKNLDFNNFRIPNCIETFYEDDEF